MNDSIDTPNVIKHPINIQHRPGNYRSNGEGNNSNRVNGVNGEKKEYKKLHVLIGDLVQVIDPKSHLVKKYGLVEEIHARNPQYQVIMKIGAVRNPLRFEQLRFCARVTPTINNGLLKNGNTKCEIEDIETGKVSDYIDEIDENEDNKGNREGANLEHGKKL